MKVRLFLSMACVSLLIPGITTYAADADRLLGVWERVSLKNLDTGQENPNPAFLIITKEHFSLTSWAPDRKKLDKPVQEMTEEELRDRLRFVAIYGTYSVSGSNFTRHRLKALNPIVEGTDSHQEYGFDGDELVLRGKNRRGAKIESRFKRIE